MTFHHFSDIPNNVDRLEQMRLFVRVVERASFTAAASDLGLSRATATEGLKSLEASLGARLLERTTRHVAPTADGQDYYARCLSILAEVDEAEGSLKDDEPRGLLRVDAHGNMTRTILLPRLHEFLDRYPRIDLHLGQKDRLVDLVREGIDVVIRAGEPSDSGLILRRLATIEEITVASPSYLERHGPLGKPEDLAHHQMIGFVSSRTGEVMPLELTIDGQVKQLPVRARITVDNSDTMAELARLGWGLVQAPRYRFARELADGTLVQVLKQYPLTPTPVCALYPQHRQISRRLRVFLDWVSEIFKTANL